MLILDPRLAGPDGIEVSPASGPVTGVAVAGAAAGEECQDWTILDASSDASTLAVPATDKPAGRFAVDAALRAAADSLDYTTHPAHIVLVVAGGPQCISVACSLSRTLASDGMDFKVDVLGLSPAAERLRCIADNTGGIYRAVERQELQQVLTGVLTSAAEERRQDGVAVGTADGEDAKDPAPVPIEGTTPLAVTDSIRKVAGIPIPPPAPRRQQATEPAKIDMKSEPDSDASGLGVLKALTWAAVETEKETGQAVVVMEPAASDGQPAAQGVRLQAVAAEGAAPLTSELTFEVLAVEGDGAYRLVGRSWAPEPVFDLPAGEYVARVTHGGIVREHRFQTHGNGLEQQTIPLNLGYVALSAAATADAPPLESDLRYSLRRVGGGAPIVRYSSQPVLALPAGEYEVSVESGAARAVSTLEISAGETVSKVFDLRLGYLRLRPASGSAAPMAVSIEADSGGFGSDWNRPTLAEAESRNGEVVRQMVYVAPGRLTQVTLGRQTAQTEWELGQF